MSGKTNLKHEFYCHYLVYLDLDPRKLGNTRGASKLGVNRSSLVLSASFRYNKKAKNRFFSFFFNCFGDEGGKKPTQPPFPCSASKSIMETLEQCMKSAQIYP